jgi:hypothetical protein
MQNFSEAVSGCEKMVAIISELQNLFNVQGEHSKQELARIRELITEFRDLTVPIPSEISDEITNLTRGNLTAALFKIGQECDATLKK